MRRKQSQLRKQENEFSAAVLEHFLATGQPATRADIAARLSVSTAKASRLQAELSGDALDWTSVERSAQSKDYPGFHLRNYRVEAFLPTRDTLRNQVIKLRAELPPPPPDCDICMSTGVVRSKRRNSFTMKTCVCRLALETPARSIAELVQEDIDERERERERARSDIGGES